MNVTFIGCEIIDMFQGN